MQRRRVHFITAAAGVGVVHLITALVDESNGLNVHGLRASFIVEPENADANANGSWALWCLPRETTAVPTTTVAALEVEGDNNVMWACGVWAATNQTPAIIDIAPATSRNCPQGTRIVLAVNPEGISAGNVRVRQCITYFGKSL